MILNRANIKYLECLQNGRPAHGAGGKGLISAGYVEYLWDVGGDILTERQYEAMRVASPTRHVKASWAGESITDSGRVILRKRQALSRARGESDNG